MLKLNLLRFTFCFFAYLLFFNPVEAQSVSPEWTRTVNSRVDGADIGKAICEDGLGNVLVLGEVKQNASTGTEILLQKFDLNGALLWEKGYHNSFLKNDEAIDVGTDALGNVYALVNSFVSSPSSPDILLIKYDPAGSMLWQAVYDGTGNMEDIALELHVTAGGEATICGTSESQSSTRDILVLRYDSGGSAVYQNRRVGATLLYQSVWDMEVGPTGDVYVTGSNGLVGGGPAADMCVYKVGTSGLITWDTSYASTLPNFASLRSIEMSLNSAGELVLLLLDENQNDHQLKLLALDQNGNQTGYNVLSLTNTLYLIPYSMGIASDGSVYVTYQFMDNLFSEGRHLWKSTSGLQTVWDKPIDASYTVQPEIRHTLKFHPSGNLLLAGVRSVDSLFNYYPDNFIVMELDSAGGKIREREWNGPGDGQEFLVDFWVASSGAVLLTGQAKENYRNRDLVNLKMDFAANSLWYSLAGRKVNGKEEFIALKKDGAGNIYLGGRVTGSNTHYGFHLAKFDPAGTLLMDTVYMLPFSASFWAMDMDVNALGHVAMAGHGSIENNGNQALYLCHIAANGTLLWWDTLQTNTPGLVQTAKCVAFDGSGNIYLGANDRFAINKEAWYVAKYNSGGTRIWGQRLLPQNPTAFYGFSDLTKIMPDGNEVWFAGQLDGNLAYRKLGQTGNLVSSLEHTAGTSNANSDFTIDPFGNPILLGRGEDSLLQGYRWGTYKFNSSGSLLWSGLIPGNGLAYAEPEDLETDALGNVYVCGRTGFYKYSVAKYDPAGNLVWQQDYGNGANAQEVGARALLPTAGGGMVSAGLNGDSPPRMRVVNTNPGGWANWIFDYYPGGGLESVGLGMVYGQGGELYVAGWQSGDTTGKDLLLLKFDQVTALEDGFGSGEAALYPNPAHGLINVDWKEGLVSEVIKVEVIDLGGRTMIQESVSVITIQKGRFPVDISTLRPGMYFMQLENDLGAKVLAKFLVR